MSGPSSGPPITERHFGTVAREVDEVTPLPVLSVRAGAARHGPVTLADNVTVGLRRPLTKRAGGAEHVRRAWVPGPDRRPACFARAEPSVPPRISVLIATYDRPDLLRACLASFAEQTLDRSEYEVVVVDDGSERDDLAQVLGRVHARAADRRPADRPRRAQRGQEPRRLPRPRHRSSCSSTTTTAPRPTTSSATWRATPPKPGEAVAILGHTDWAPELELTPLMHYITDVDRLMFAYERLGDGQELDWRGFWEGRISCKRSLLVRHGLHDQRLGYSIDVEMGWRLAPPGCG